MKQTFKLTVTAPASNYHLEIQGVYQSDSKLIAIARLSKSNGFGSASLTERTAAIEIEVNDSKKLPVTCYVIADDSCEVPASVNRISTEEATDKVKGLASLAIRNIDLKEYNSIINQAKRLSGLNRNTLFAVTAITVATAVTGITLMAQKL